MAVHEGSALCRVSSDSQLMARSLVALSTSSCPEAHSSSSVQDLQEQRSCSDFVLAGAFLLSLCLIL